MERRRKLITRVIVFLLLGAIVNVAVAFAFGRGAEWPGLGRLELRGNLLADAELQLFWARYGARHVTHTQPEWGEWVYRGWQYTGMGYTFIGIGNNYAPPSAGTRMGPQLGAWRGEPGSICIAIVKYGWPLRSIYGSAVSITDVRPVLNPNKQVWQKNIRPILPGFAINTVFYAAMLWVLFIFPFVLRRKRRIWRGLCPACAYPIGTSPVCTECGKEVNPVKSVTLSP